MCPFPHPLPRISVHPRLHFCSFHLLLTSARAAHNCWFFIDFEIVFFVLFFSRSPCLPFTRFSGFYFTLSWHRLFLPHNYSVLARTHAAAAHIVFPDKSFAAISAGRMKKVEESFSLYSCDCVCVWVVEWVFFSLLPPLSKSDTRVWDVYMCVCVWIN